MSRTIGGLAFQAIARKSQEEIAQGMATAACEAKIIQFCQDFFGESLLNEMRAELDESDRNVQIDEDSDGGLNFHVFLKWRGVEGGITAYVPPSHFLFSHLDFAFSDEKGRTICSMKIERTDQYSADHHAPDEMLSDFFLKLEQFANNKDIPF